MKLFTLVIACMISLSVLPLRAATSLNVAVVGSAPAVSGGALPTSGADLVGVTFTNLAPSNVTTANLAAFDTLVLNVASLQMGCNTGNLSAGAKADLVTWVQAGHKLIIYDSECSPQNYSWLPFSFTTSNPGAHGATGTLTIVENNTLSSTVGASPYFIDAPAIGSTTDAVGDGNVMTTLDANWCVDMSATNTLGVTGPIHTYAKTGIDNGLIIYNGFDIDRIGDNTAGGLAIRKTFVLEIRQPFNTSGLPCGVTAVGITLTPGTAINNLGTTHTITATLTDQLGAPKPNITVTFAVTAGPNTGATGVCSPITCQTAANGQVTFTYTGIVAGTDTITASFSNGGTVVTSQPVQKTWVQPLTITTQPVNAAVCAGATATFTAAAIGAPTPIVQWQVSTNGGGTFADIPGATSTTLSIVTVAAMNNNQYRAVFTNTGGTLTTNAATLTVNTAPLVTTNPVSQTVTVGNPVTFTAAATGQPTPTVQWQVSTDNGGSWSSIAGATNLSLTFVTNAAMNNNQYRAVFTNTCGVANTSAATLTVQTAPQITLQPSNQTVCAGSTATFMSAASGNPTPTVQWQVSVAGGPFTNIPGATSTTLNIVTTAAMNGNRYQAVFTNVVGTATSNIATLTVNTAPVVTTVPVDQTVNEGQPVTFTAAASGQPTPTVQWQVSVNGGPFTDIAGATATTYTFIASQAATKNRYRAVFTNTCGIANSDPAIFINIPFDSFQIRYAVNLTQGDSVVNMSNTGVNGASLNGPGFGGAAGNICVNAYTFSPDEQLISCCSCLLTPNALASLSVAEDLISNTLTGVRPNSVVIKLVATGAGADFTGGTCTNSAALAGTTGFPLAPGLVALGTTLHPPAITETPFLRGTLSLQELASITNRCTNIVGNGSTFGICRSCRVGGLSGAK